MYANERFVSIFTDSVADEIRETITSLFKEKYSLTGKNDFVFLKREKFKIHHPAVCPGFKWNFSNIKTLLGQGNLYSQLKEDYRSIVLNDVETKEVMFK